MRLRIKEVKYINGEIEYYPQYKFLGLFWTHFTNLHDVVFVFNDVDECEKWIEEKVINRKCRKNVKEITYLG